MYFRKPFLSPEAQDDLYSIQAYTTQQWGAEQTRKYRDAMITAFASIRENPEIGAPLPDDPKYRYLPVGSHVIIYILKNDNPEVARILHQRASRKTL